MKICHYTLMICCCLMTACNSDDPQFPIEETLTEELMLLQGITNPIRVEVKLLVSYRLWL